MSFIDCIKDNTLLTKAQKNKILDNYDGIKSEYLKHSLDIDAASIAAEKLAGQMADELAKKKLNTIKDVLTWKNAVLPEIQAKKHLYAGKKAKAKFGKFLFGNESSHVAKVKLEDIAVRHAAVEREHTLMMNDAIEKNRSKLAGLTQDTKGFKDVVRGLLGGNTSPAAKVMADTIRESFDSLHRRYKNAGGILGYIENYFPQQHNIERISKVSFDEWKAVIKSKIDITKMIDFRTGLPMTEKKLDDLLPELHASIVSNGLSELEERVAVGKTTPGGKATSMAQRRAFSRFFVFKDADAFLSYNAQFGVGDEGLFEAMMGHVSAMSRDISIMESLGPKPELMIERLKLWSEVGGAGQNTKNTLQGMYDVLAGRTSFNGQLPTWYKAVQSHQDWLRSTLLGGAPVAAMTDSFYGAATAKLNGIPAGKFIGFYGSLLNPLNDADRRVAKRIAFISGSASGASLSASRMMEGSGGRGIPGWLAGFTNRASGLSAMTDAARQGITLSTMGHLAELSATATKWADVEPEIKEAFQRWNMSEADYDNMMKAKAYVDPDSGADFLRPEDLKAAGFSDTANKYGMWLIDMAQSASNEPRLLTRYITSGGYKKGTWQRAAIGSLTMFKSFGLTVMINHTIPAARRFATTGNPTELLGSMLLTTTLLGAMAIQTRDVIYGKTPRDMSDPKFWAASMMQGGGFGIFGDFLFSDQSRFQNNLAVTLAGPQVGFVSDLFRVFKGNFDKALDDGQESKFMSDLYQFGKRNIPAVKLWYTRLLMERLFLDQVERAIDPLFDTRMQRIEGKMKKEKGQEFWWKPGDLAPE